MCRFLLENDVLLRINNQIPHIEVEELSKRILSNNPTVIALEYGPDDAAHITQICLEDTIDAVYYATYALQEAYAHKIFYSEITPPIQRKQNLDASVVFSLFYIENIALRLYAAAEHVANALIHLFNITRADLQANNSGETKSSLQIEVGKFLKKNYPDHPITQSILELVRSQEWVMLSKYRNDFTHNQPPLVEGLGLRYQRKNHWEVSEDGRIVQLALFDSGNYQYDIEVFLENSRKALYDFVSMTEIVVDNHEKLMQDKQKIVKVENNTVEA